MINKINELNNPQFFRVLTRENGGKVVIRKDNTTLDVFKPTHFTITYLCYGDYDNSCFVERANVISMEEICKEENIKTINKKGFYGGTELLLPLKAINNEIIYETLCHLMDYPIIDDEKLSELENEAKHEAISDFANRKDLDKDIIESLLQNESSDEYGHPEAGGIWYLNENRLLKDYLDAFDEHAENAVHALKKHVARKIHTLQVERNDEEFIVTLTIISQGEPTTTIFTKPSEIINFINGEK